jgi:hypothetical protein
MKQLEALGARLDGALTALEAHTASPFAEALLGVAMAVGLIGGGLVGLFVFLKLLTALF